MACSDVIGRGADFFLCADAWLSRACKWLRAAAAALEASGEASMTRILCALASALCGATSPALWLQLSLLTLAFSLLVSSADGPKCHLRSSCPAAAQQRKPSLGCVCGVGGRGSSVRYPRVSGPCSCTRSRVWRDAGSHIQRSPLSMGARTQSEPGVRVDRVISN